MALALNSQYNCLHYKCSFSVVHSPYSKTNYMIWAPTKPDQDPSGHLHCWASQLPSLLKNSSSLDH
jgi:hypothetical protein